MHIWLVHLCLALAMQCKNLGKMSDLNYLGHINFRNITFNIILSCIKFDNSE